MGTAANSGTLTVIELENRSNYDIVSTNLENKYLPMCVEKMYQETETMLMYLLFRNYILTQNLVVLECLPGHLFVILFHITNSLHKILYKCVLNKIGL